MAMLTAGAGVEALAAGSPDLAVHKLNASPGSQAYQARQKALAKRSARGATVSLMPSQD